MLPDESADWRLFVAISLPAPLSRSLQSPRDAIAGSSAPKFRWTHPDDLHLTLFFFGGVEPDKISALSKTMSEVASTNAPLSLGVRGLGAFPDPEHPRVLWAGLNDSLRLQSLQKSISEKVASLGFKQEREKFIPHITLARVRESQSLEAFVSKFRHYQFGEFEASDLVLYRSRPNPDGPRYQALERFPLST